MARVFVSFASRDFALASEVHRWLVDNGHDAFLDRDLGDGILVGEEWQQRLHERLRWADAVVCVLTSAYIASPWCTAELGIAQSRGSRLLPVRAEPGAAHPLLDSIQYVDMTADAGVARAKLAAALLRVDAAGGRGWSDDRSPFPGLRPLDTDEHSVFFGRGQEIHHLATLLRAPAERADPAVLLIVGPSGCGKSSLVRAGLLPVMAADEDWWTLPAILPGRRPVAALASALAHAAHEVGLSWTVTEVDHRLHHGDLTLLVHDLLLAVPGRRRYLLLVVDQFEELLAQTGLEERARFAKLLFDALAGPVQVLATLRPEFLDPLLASPELAALPARTQTVRPLRPEALRAVIEGPADRAGIGVDEELVARLVADTGGGEALPLLAYTLEKLAAGVTRGGRLSATRYEELGGVRGALARQADVALAEAAAIGKCGRDEVIRALLRLVTVDDRGNPTRWRLPQSALDPTVLAQLEPFVARRLLVVDLDVAGTVIEVAHEAFLSEWEPLARAITANVVALRTERAIEQAAADWINHGRSSTRLWERGQLASALADVSADGQLDTVDRGRARWLPSIWRRLSDFVGRRRPPVAPGVVPSRNAEEFLRASIRFDQRRRRRGTLVLTVLLLVAMTGAGVAYAQLRVSQEQQQLATARLLLTQAEAVVGTDPQRALQLGEAAYSIRPDGESRSRLVNLLLATRYAGSFSAQTGVLESVAFAPDRRTLATAAADKTVALWDLSDVTRPRLAAPLLSGHVRPVRSVAFSPDGRLLATGGADGVVLLWDVRDPARVRRLDPPLTGHDVGIGAVAFSSDSRLLATAGDDGIVGLWDVAAPTQARAFGPPIIAGTGAIRSVAFAREGRVLASAGDDGTVVLWDVSNPAEARALGPPVVTGAAAVRSVAFSPDGHLLAAGGDDHVIMLHDVTDPTHPRALGLPLAGHRAAVRTVVFSPDGRALASAGGDEAVLLWDVTDAARPRLQESLGGQVAGVNGLAFSPNGSTLAAVGDGKATVLWDLGDTARAHQVGPPLGGHTGPVRSITFSPDGRLLATAGDDTTIVIWDVSDPDRPSRLGEPVTGNANGIFSLTFAPTKHVLASGGADDLVMLWDVTDPARPKRLGSSLNGHSGSVWSVAFTQDGRTLASAAWDSTVVLADVTDPARPTGLGPALRGHTNSVWAVAFSPDGRTLASASQDGTTILWDVADRARPLRFNPPLIGHNGAVLSVAFSSDGQTLATGGADNAIILWDVTHPAQATALGTPLVGHSGPIHSVAFSPDGLTLASASADGTVVLWDVTDRTQARRLGSALTGSSPELNSVTFARTGTLATAGSDGTVSLWDLSGMDRLRKRPLARACAISGSGFTPAEWARDVPESTYRDPCRDVE